MNALPTNVKTSSGRTFHLTKQIGKGGEGAVYEAAEAVDLAFKLYWPNLAQSRREKLSAMTTAAWYKTNPFVAFPIDILFSNGVFVGFVMRKVGGHKPVHLLFSPASRKLEFGRTSFRFLIRSAGNIARAVASVHGTGCVIGDVNESGFLVSDKATSVVIDSDSFQVATGQKNFLCHVGKAEYTPPELQNVSLDQATRAPNHDNFGLAVLVFQLLFMGKHPYSGRYSGSEDMPISRAIAEHRFAYSDQRAITKMQPPPSAPLLSDFPNYVAQAFECAFSNKGLKGRPTASQWVEMLKNLETELIQCSADNNHHHVRGKPCPWCRMEQGSPGFIAFGAGRQTVFVPMHVDASQFCSILQSIGDPGPWPDFTTQLILPSHLLAAPAAANLLEQLKRRSVAGIAASGIGAVLICYGGSAIFPGFGLLAVGIYATAIAPKELVSLREATSKAGSSLKAVRDIWNKEAGDKSFWDSKSRIGQKLGQLSDIPNEEKRGISELERRKKELQLKRYLSAFLIKKAKISKIGTGRKTTLASYNIETAADVDPSRIQSIPGFGPSLVSELVGWQRGLAAKFVFNPNEPTSPIDLAALKSKLSAKKAALEKSLRDDLNSLKQTAVLIVDQRKKFIEAGNRAFGVLKQAELNEQAANGPLQKSSKFISFCCAGLAAWGLLTGKGEKNSPPNVERKIETTIRSVPREPSKSTPPQSTQREEKTIPQVAPGPSAPQGRLSASNSPVRPTIENPGNMLRSPNAAQGPGPTAKTEPLSGAPPLPPPEEIPVRPQSEILPGATRLLMDTNNVADATKMQQRLIDLGFLTGPADGKWGPKSRRAIAEFKASRQLTEDTTWDERAQLALFDSNQDAQRFRSNARPIDTMALALFGGWTGTQGECGNSSEPPPMTIDAIGASTSGGFCQFSDIRQEANNIWRVSGRCSVGSDSWTSNIRLAITSSALKWTSEKGEQLFYRCPSRTRF
jgi:DNA-binding helix-hairpin-helix protein with protein kinase domain